MDHCVIIFAGFCLLLYIFLTQGTIKRHVKDKTDHLQPWLNSLEVQICQVFKFISKISICLWHRECIKLLKTSYDMNTKNEKQKVLPISGHSCIYCTVTVEQMDGWINILNFFGLCLCVNMFSHPQTWKNNNFVQNMCRFFHLWYHASMNTPWCANVSKI